VTVNYCSDLIQARGNAQNMQKINSYKDAIWNNEC